MKAIKYFLLTIVLLALTHSCKKTDDDVQASLSINPVQKDVEASQGNFNIAVSSTVQWTASCDKSWISINPMTGSGIGTVKADFQANTSSVTRSASIVFKGANVEDRIVSVTQSGVLPFLSITPANQNVNADQGNTAFAISSNTNWIASSDQIWCTLSQTSGIGNTTLTAGYIANTLQIERTAKITLSSQGVSDQYATVTQAPFVPSLFVTPANQNVNALPGNTTFIVTANIEWAASSDQNWCTINTGGSGNGTINANFSENTANEARTAHISITGFGVSNQIVTVTQAGNSLTQGLVAYYPFNGNANDESGNGNNGTVWGASLTEDRKGNTNCAYNFDGVNDYIEVPSSNSLSLDAAITISAWIQTTNSTDYSGIACKWDCRWNASQRAYYLALYNGKLHAAVQYNGVTTIYGNGLINNNNWHHVAVTVDNVSQRIRLLVDGILDIETQISGSMLSQNDIHLLIGVIELTCTPNYWFTGKIDDIRIYNRALTESEIQQLYNE